jgi:hypothetical protein
MFDSELPQFDVNGYLDLEFGDEVASMLIKEGVNPYYWGDRELPPQFYKDRPNTICVVKNGEGPLNIYSGLWVGNEKPICIITFKHLTEAKLKYWMKILETYFNEEHNGDEQMKESFRKIIKINKKE